MVRKWITPVAALALLAGLSNATAADDAPTTAPAAGKATISVKVVDGDGKAVAGATVDLLPPNAGRRNRPAPGADPTPKPMSADPADPANPAPPTHQRRVRPKPLQETTSDGDGAATLKDVADGSYVVMARLKGSGNGREPVTVADGKDVSVTVTIKSRN